MPLHTKELDLGSANGLRSVLEGSWDLITRVINKVIVLIITYSLN